ncbi:hypothetical protein OS493_039896 [Desmophyllum pertusum]|uniref:Uncharacterized protein n=1 Tax=Desmophyllum pertusum TaxID=174260 RepID=A0A9X0CZV4_9CNID|nr:hypothetical protein OS493_039896 [Desmophyllum pertusum]
MDGVNGSGNGAGKMVKGRVVCGRCFRDGQRPPELWVGVLGLTGSEELPLESAGGWKDMLEGESVTKEGESFSEGGEGGEQSNCDGAPAQEENTNEQEHGECHVILSPADLLSDNWPPLLSNLAVHFR